MPQQLASFKFLITCFVHERKHKIAKRWALPLCTGNQRNYEQSMLEECTMAHMLSLKEPIVKTGLQETTNACPQVVAALKKSGFSSAESALTGRTARVD